MFQDVFVTDNPIYIKVIPLHPLKTFVLLNDSFDEVPYVEISLDEFHDVFTYVRLIGSIPLVCDTDPDAITQHFEAIRKKVRQYFCYEDCEGRRKIILQNIILLCINPWAIGSTISENGK